MSDNKYGKELELTIKDFKKGKDSYSIKKNKGKKGLIVFYAAFCGYCNMLVPEWEEFHKKYKNKYFIGAVNTQNEKGGNHIISGQMGVSGIPDIRYVDEEGRVTNEKFDGDRNVKNFAAYLEKK